MLTVHKNTKEQRDAKKVRCDLMQDANKLKQHPGISGYAIVVWNKDCMADCSWQSTAPVMPGLVVPEFSKQILKRVINQNDANYLIDERFR